MDKVWLKPIFERFGSIFHSLLFGFAIPRVHYCSHGQWKTNTNPDLMC